jgi:hypothetical protein
VDPLPGRSHGGWFGEIEARALAELSSRERLEALQRTTAGARSPDLAPEDTLPAADCAVAAPARAGETPEQPRRRRAV